VYVRAQISTLTARAASARLQPLPPATLAPTHLRVLFVRREDYQRTLKRRLRVLVRDLWDEGGRHQSVHRTMVP